MTMRPSIRRNDNGLLIENAAGRHIATMSPDTTLTHGCLTNDELRLVALVAENFDLFYENVIEE